MRIVKGSELRRGDTICLNFNEKREALTVLSNKQGHLYVNAYLTDDDYTTRIYLKNKTVYKLND